LTTSDRLIKENPQTVKSALRALLKATRFMDVNRQETIQVMMKWVKQPAEIAARSYDVELRSLARDGQMSDADLESFIDRLGEKRRPLDEVRDFSFARQAFKELEAGK
jgi:ABC-type nitrate/sulfonate/bicarbonate transport system substrate-binding protein